MWNSNSRETSIKIRNLISRPTCKRRASANCPHRKSVTFPPFKRQWKFPIGGDNGAIDRPIGISLIIVLRHDPVPFLRCVRSAVPFAARVPDPDLSSHLSGRSCPNYCCSWTWLVTGVPPIQMEFPFPPISAVGCMALQRPPDATHRGISISYCAPCSNTFALWYL